MLKVNVGLSRKLSRDFNSQGFSVNIEGEVLTDLNDAEATVVRIQQFYDVAEEALSLQVQRYQSDVAIASRDAAPPTPSESPQPTTATPSVQRGVTTQTPLPLTPNRPTGTSEPATNKQVQFLLSIGKRHGLTKPQLENRIAEIVGQRRGIYDLTKRDAGVVLDALTADSKSATGGR